MVILGPWLLHVSAASLGYMNFKIHKTKLLIFVCSQVFTHACVCRLWVSTGCLTALHLFLHLYEGRNKDVSRPWWCVPESQHSDS